MRPATLRALFVVSVIGPHHPAGRQKAPYHRPSMRDCAADFQATTAACNAGKPPKMHHLF
jgi:hypothetical protein